MYVIIVQLATIIQSLAPLAANTPHSGLSSANSVASSTLRLWSFFIVASQGGGEDVLPTFSSHAIH